MHKIISISTSLIYTAILTACATASDTGTFTPTSAHKDQTAVYVYRPTAMANALYSPDLYVNEEFKLTIKNSSNSRIPLSAGEYNFKLKTDNKHASTNSLLLTLKPGNTYYLRVTTTLKVSNTSNYEPYLRDYTLEKIPETQAVVEIGECCSTQNKQPSDEPKIAADNKPTDGGFSVDKTQNPFSKSEPK